MRTPVFKASQRVRSQRPPELNGVAFRFWTASGASVGSIAGAPKDVLSTTSRPNSGASQRMPKAFTLGRPSDVDLLGQFA